MELPQQLTTDLKIVQRQMKLEIQTHQIMRIKQASDPSNFKLDDLREVEKRISSLGEKQNQLMRWLRKILTTIPSNSALMAKTIASSLGITVNGTHPCSGAQVNNFSTNTKCSSVLKSNHNRNTRNPLKDHTKNNGMKNVYINEKKTPDELMGQLSFNTESKDGICEKEMKILSQNVPENCFPQKIAKQPHINNERKFISPSPENDAHLCDPLTAEKERFLSAVGLVTRDVLKELQNRRVERKRRSTANHTQFVYGSNWEISTKKRKKSNYLASTAKQHVTRQTAATTTTSSTTTTTTTITTTTTTTTTTTSRTQNLRSEMPHTSSKYNPTVSIFKTPLPIFHLNQHDTTDALNTGSSCHKTTIRGQSLASNDESDLNGNCVQNAATTVVQEENRIEACVVCQKTDANTIICSCNMQYHCMCAEVVENCIGCGTKLKNNVEDRRAEMHRLQEMNSQLNSEKEELETRAAELSVTLATQAEKKKNLLSLEEDVRKKIQRIHEFVAIMKNSQSVPSS